MLDDVVREELALYGYPEGTEVLTVRIEPSDVIVGDYIWWSFAQSIGGWVTGEAVHRHGKRDMPAWTIRKPGGGVSHIFKESVGGGIGLRPAAPRLPLSAS